MICDQNICLHFIYQKLSPHSIPALSWDRVRAFFLAAHLSINYYSSKNERIWNSKRLWLFHQVWKETKNIDIKHKGSRSTGFGQWNVTLFFIANFFSLPCSTRIQRSCEKRWPFTKIKMLKNAKIGLKLGWGNMGSLGNFLAYFWF